MKVKVSNMADNKFDKKTFLDFLELTQNKPLNRDEMDRYINGFCSYMEDHANTINEEIKSTNKRQINTASHIRVNKLINIGTSLFLLVTILALFLSSINITLLSVLGILIMIILVITFATSIKNIGTIYIHSRNTRNIKVGHTYIYDVNGIHRSFMARSDIYDGKNPFDVGENIKTNTPSFPIMFLVTNIGYNFIYCLDPSDGMIFRLPISEADYLTCIDDMDINSKQIIIRYPYTIPTFTYEDCKILEASLILAHADNKENLYNGLANTLAKVRFYTEEPYGTLTKEKVEEYASKNREAIDFLNHIKKGYYKEKEDLFEDNDDIFGDAD